MKLLDTRCHTRSLWEGRITLNLWERPLKMKVNDSEFGRIGHSGTSHPSGRSGLAASPPKHTQSPLMDAQPRLLAPKGLPLRQLLFCLQLCSSCRYPPTAAPVAAVTASRPLPAGALDCSPTSTRLSLAAARPVALRMLTANKQLLKTVYQLPPSHGERLGRAREELVQQQYKGGGNAFPLLDEKNQYKG